jgi:P4 family phage/plasmid primase-like protien
MDSWFVCDSDIWVKQHRGDGPAMSLAMQLARKMADECGDQARALMQRVDTDSTLDDKQINQIGKAAESLEKRAVNLEKSITVQNMVKLAKPMPQIVASVARLDQHPYMIGTQSGVLDLAKQEIVPNGKDLMVSRRVPHSYDPKAKCPRFEEFLCQMLKGNTDLLDMMCRWFGYLVSGSTESQSFVILYGERGRNGKGVLFNILSHVLGPEYAAPIDRRLLFKSMIEPPRFSLANVEGKRLVFHNEASSNATLDTEFIKSFTAGDPMYAEHKGVQGYSFSPQAKLMLAVNTLPWANFDDSFRSRAIAIPLEQSFYDQSSTEWRDGDIPPDPQLLDKLKEESAGIFAFLVEQFSSFRARGLAKPIAVNALIAEFEQENDRIGQWIADCCEIGADHRTQCTTLWHSFTTYCKAMRLGNPGRVNEFSKRLDKEIGLEHIYPNNKSTFVGIGLKPTDQQEAWWNKE